ncbi:DNA-directed RNA polymerase [Picrophilus oshimae]|uniref:DNA-directed RNA polymerase subunit Rpo7 n=1 Tax=Picrophilus torridus (strain ATCC 700027 / DSM 9790 / JCM 10055 / NBRC 100828 / KAW 2/3) TaxID=1122961 RepID=Q6L0Q1_PICTO|nr:DNA-directed RNA polymerase [Picrophilus oshimae]AAT43451.1 DNA-directed RNA polymerase subunit E' [Picrophilus oshimae DSM 9789]SMD30240.1 DNA-directed RNA polymerase, subunit E' [Picrophilus oshimae DSM 9789]
MYISLENDYVARVPPELLGDDYREAVLEITKRNLVGKLVDINDSTGRNMGKCFIVSIENIELVGDGTIVHGDGGVYQDVVYTAIAYYPKMHEVVDGVVISIQKFGAFVKFGPFEGLLHISQIMDDIINIDMANQRFVGRDTKEDLKIGDKIRVRIVAMNLSSSSIEDAKIGLTAKQPGLGKENWTTRTIKRGETQ